MPMQIQRYGRYAAAALLALTVSGCATKGDVRNLRLELHGMRQHQDSVLLELQRQNRQMLDSIRTTIALTVDARGATTAQLRQFDTSVAQLEQLVGQIMGGLTRIEQRISDLERRPAGVAGAAAGGGTAEQYYQTGMQMMSQQAYATARMAFEQLLQEFPDHERSPDALFQVAETYYHDQQFDRAYEALELVAQRWPGAARTPAALFRAGAIAEERRDFPKARGYYERVRREHAGSEEARQAQQKLQTLPRR
jgi:tol-pal system protein YbgF